MHSKMKSPHQMYRIVNTRLNFSVFMKVTELKYASTAIILNAL